MDTVLSPNSAQAPRKPYVLAVCPLKSRSHREWPCRPMKCTLESQLGQLNYFKGLPCSYKTNSKFSNDSDQFSQIIVFMMPAGWANDRLSCYQ